MNTIMKKLLIIVSAVFSVLYTCAAAGFAYDVVNLPESMPFSEAIGLFDTSGIVGAAVSMPHENQYVDLAKEDYLDTYYEFANTTLYRYVTPSPFRGASLAFYTSDGNSHIYYTGAGVIIGKYGENNYVCYRAKGDDETALWGITSLYYDNDDKRWGGVPEPKFSNDFLKLPTDAWAAEIVNTAAERSLVPYEFTLKYTDNITREEFCTLLGNFIAVKGNYVDLDAYMHSINHPYILNVFEDCYGTDPAVDILYALGIVNGKTDTLFDPDAYITREEAAKLLCKAAELYMFIDSPAEKNYSDRASISQWAEFFVDWVSGTGIMNGMGDNEFAPQSNYTVQQAIVTMNRLYDYVNSH